MLYLDITIYHIVVKPIILPPIALLLILEAVKRKVAEDKKIRTRRGMTKRINFLLSRKKYRSSPENTINPTKPPLDLATDQCHNENSTTQIADKPS